jgi:hypothetical protein
VLVWICGSDDRTLSTFSCCWIPWAGSTSTASALERQEWDDNDCWLIISGSSKFIYVLLTLVINNTDSFVAYLLTRAYSPPCSTAAQAFAYLVKPVARFQLALDALLPLLDAGVVEDEKNGWESVVQLAKVSFLLFSQYMRRVCALYALPHHGFKLYI